MISINGPTGYVYTINSTGIKSSAPAASSLNFYEAKDVYEDPINTVSSTTRLALDPVKDEEDPVPVTAKPDETDPKIDDGDASTTRLSVFV